MSYNTIHQCANDEAFMARLEACAAQEGEENPNAAMNSLRWKVSSLTDIEEAYEYAVNSDNPNPGGDDTVITDAQILSAVQYILNPPPPDPPVAPPELEIDLPEPEE